MATNLKVPTKSAFLNDLFERKPKITPKEAEDAWRAAGYEGDISLNTFYNYKSEFNKRTNYGAGTGEATDVKADRGSRSKGTKARKTTRPVATTANQANGHDATREPKVGKASARAENKDRALDEIEDGIDDLIYRLKHIGGNPEVLEALRRARRLLYAE